MSTSTKAPPRRRPGPATPEARAAVAAGNRARWAELTPEQRAAALEPTRAAQRATSELMDRYGGPSVIRKWALEQGLRCGKLPGRPVAEAYAATHRELTPEERAAMARPRPRRRGAAQSSFWTPEARQQASERASAYWRDHPEALAARTKAVTAAARTKAEELRPVREAEREARRVAAVQRGLDPLLDKIEIKAEYLSDAQRARLLQLADGRAEE